MSYFPSTQISDQFGFHSQLTPQGELRSISPVRLAGETFVGSQIDLSFWITSSYLNTTSSQINGVMTLISSGSLATGSLQSNHVARFIVGSSNRFDADIQLSDTGSNLTNVTRRWGPFNATDGAFFELSGSNFNVVTRIGGVDNRVTASSFNNLVSIPNFLVNSGYDIYYNMPSLYFIVNDVLLHTYTVTTQSWTSTLSLPARVEISNGVYVPTGSGESIYCRGMSILRFGNQDTQTNYTHISGSGVSVLKYSPGNLRSIVFNTSTTCVTTIYDNTTNSGTVIAVITTTSGGSPLPFSVDYGNIAFSTGLTINTSNTIDLTVTYE